MLRQMKTREDILLLQSRKDNIKLQQDFAPR